MVPKIEHPLFRAFYALLFPIVATGCVGSSSGTQGAAIQTTPSSPIAAIANAYPEVAGVADNFAYAARTPHEDIQTVGTATYSAAAYVVEPSDSGSGYSFAAVSTATLSADFDTNVLTGEASDFREVVNPEAIANITPFPTVPFDADAQDLNPVGGLLRLRLTQSGSGRNWWEGSSSGGLSNTSRGTFRVDLSVSAALRGDEGEAISVGTLWTDQYLLNIVGLEDE